MPTKLRGKSVGAFQRRLLAWYRAHRRDFPWRRGGDAYRVWLAEIMLQQTRIAAVLPYYEKFLSRFPSIEALAAAPETEVLRRWAGLGYYRRARNLHRAAKEIVARHGGKFPREWDAALALPGVGRYTAAAVLSIVYGAPHATLDGNVARVLARLAARRGDLRASGRWKHLEDAAQRLLAKSAPGDWNQALMELGETVCTPKAPQCPHCPVARWCRARELGLASRIPAARRKRVPVEVKLAAAVIVDAKGRVLVTQNPGAHDGVVFSRLWQFPATEVARDAAAELSHHLQKSLGLSAELIPLSRARHGVTFRHITLLAFLARVARLPRSAGTRACRLGDIGRFPISSATRKIAAAAAAALAPSNLKGQSPS